MAAITSTMFQPSATLASPITTAPPTTQVTLAASCLDPSNLWVVETSCFIERQHSQLYGRDNPDWLHCYETHFGDPAFAWDNPTCSFPSGAAATVEITTTAANGDKVASQQVVYYDGCASGYTAAGFSSGPAYLPFTWKTSGWYDISTYQTTCCPTSVPPSPNALLVKLLVARRWPISKTLAADILPTL